MEEKNQMMVKCIYVYWIRSVYIVSFSRKYSASNGLAAKGLHFSHPHRELSVERDLTLLSIGVAVWLHMLETMIVILARRTCSPSPLTN